MKKKLIIGLTAFQTLAMLLAFMYAFVQKAEADEQIKLANHMHEQMMQLNEEFEKCRRGK